MEARDLSHSVGLRNPDTMLLQVMDPKRPWKGTVATLDLKRSAKTRCAHRFQSAQGPMKREEGAEEAIVGEWAISRGGTSFAELAIEEIRGRHVVGRMCARKSSGSIHLFDLYKGGPHRARYDADTQTLRVVEERGGEKPRTYEFTWTDRDEVDRTVATQEDAGHRETETMRRGRRWGGCLARTSARIAKIEGTWRPRRAGGTNLAVTVSEDRGADRIKGRICARDDTGRVEITPFGHEEDGTRIRSVGNTLEIIAGDSDETMTHVLNTDPTKPKRLMYDRIRDGDADGEGGGEITLTRTKRKICEEQSPDRDTDGDNGNRATRERDSDGTLLAHADTWTGRTRHGSSTLRIRRDAESGTVQGVICSEGADGTARGFKFSTGRTEHGVRALGGAERLTVWAGRTIRTYQPDAGDPSTMKVSVRTGRTRETDEGEQKTLKAHSMRLGWTDARTCADLFTIEPAGHEQRQPERTTHSERGAGSGRTARSAR